MMNRVTMGSSLKGATDTSVTQRQRWTAPVASGELPAGDLTGGGTRRAGQRNPRLAPGISMTPAQPSPPPPFFPSEQKVRAGFAQTVLNGSG